MDLELVEIAGVKSFHFKCEDTFEIEFLTMMCNNIAGIKLNWERDPRFSNQISVRHQEVYYSIGWYCDGSAWTTIIDYKIASYAGLMQPGLINIRFCLLRRDIIIDGELFPIADPACFDNIAKFVKKKFRIELYEIF